MTHPTGPAGPGPSGPSTPKPKPPDPKPKGQAMTAIVAGSRVTVHDPRGDWQGYVRQMPDGPYEHGGPMPPAIVAVHHPQASGLAAYSVHRVPVRFLGAPYAGQPEPIADPIADPMPRPKPIPPKPPKVVSVA